MSVGRSSARPSVRPSVRRPSQLPLRYSFLFLQSCVWFYLRQWMSIGGYFLFFHLSVCLGLLSLICQIPSSKNRTSNVSWSPTVIVSSGQFMLSEIGNLKTQLLILIFSFLFQKESSNFGTVSWVFSSSSTLSGLLYLLPCTLYTSSQVKVISIIRTLMRWNEQNDSIRWEQQNW